MNSFSLVRPPKILFGSGSIEKIGDVASTFGKQALLVVSRSLAQDTEVMLRITRSLKKCNVGYKKLETSGEPSPALVDETVQQYAGSGITTVISIGGGSVIDAGKAIAAMLPLNEPVTGYLEEIGTKPHPGVKVPFIAVPTTAGTGSEASANAVLSTTGPDGFKKSLRHENFVSEVALVDPDLAASCPAAITAACGMDALTQLQEAYVSPRANQFTDALIEGALPCVAGCLQRAVEAGETDSKARTGMAWAALVSGIALANAGLGVVHGLASPIGAYFPVPHGVVCGTLLAPAIQATIRELERVERRHPVLEKYATLGRLVSGRAGLSTKDGCAALIEKVTAMTESLRIPRLSIFGITVNDVKKIVAGAGNRNNPLELTKEQMTEIVLSRL
jgi:alcohol dehydrogenase class IV